MRRLKSINTCFAALLLVLISGCRSPQPTTRSAAELLAARTNYPAHWWAPVSTNGAAGWESLPQQAGPGEVILSKRQQRGALSKFAATPCTLSGKRYASLVGSWQRMKNPEKEDEP